MKRFIFDLDGTLLDGDYTLEDEFFRDVIEEKEKVESFIKNKYYLLMKYEELFIRYDTLLLSEFLSRKSGVKITEKMIKEWIEINKYIPNIVHEDAHEILEELKRSNKEIVMCTNWFRETQIGRLKQEGLYEYFDEIYGGDEYLKPNSSIYLKAADNRVCESIMIGDNIEKDFLGPRKVGVQSILYDPSDYKCGVEPRINKLIKVKEWI